MDIRGADDAFAVGAKSGDTRGWSPNQATGSAIIGRVERWS